MSHNREADEFTPVTNGATLKAAIKAHAIPGRPSYVTNTAHDLMSLKKSDFDKFITTLAKTLPTTTKNEPPRYIPLSALKDIKSKPGKKQLDTMLFSQRFVVYNTTTGTEVALVSYHKETKPECMTIIDVTDKTRWNYTQAMKPRTAYESALLEPIFKHLNIEQFKPIPMPEATGETEYQCPNKVIHTETFPEL